jgi:hypothetical protein
MKSVVCMKSRSSVKWAIRIVAAPFILVVGAVILVAASPLLLLMAIGAVIDGIERLFKGCFSAVTWAWAWDRDRTGKDGTERTHHDPVADWLDHKFPVPSGDGAVSIVDNGELSFPRVINGDRK